MILFDFINLRKIKKALLYDLVVLLGLWLQTSVFSRGIFPGGLNPFFLPLIPAAVGLWENGVWGGIFGLLMGLSADMRLTGSTVLFTLLFSAIGFFSGILGEYFINRRLVSFLILSAGLLLVTAACQSVSPLVFRAAALRDVVQVGLLQTLWSLPFGIPIYLAAKAIAGGRKRE